MELPFPIGDECGEAVVEQGKEERISVTYVGQGVEGDVETPAQKKRRNATEDFFPKDGEGKNEDCTPDGKGMDGPSNRGIPDRVPEGVVHPFQEAPIGKDPWEKRDHIDKVGENAPYTHFPGPGFSEKEGEVPEKVFVRVHGM